MSSRKSLLLVDSDARSLRVLEVSLRKAGFSVNTADSGASALQWAFTEPPDLVITDTRLPDVSGFDLCQRLRSDNRTRQTVVVFLTEEAGPETKIAGINAGADDFLTKPVLVKEVVSRVRSLLEKRRTDSLARRERPGNLSGTLSNMGVVDLLQVMEAGKKSGIVHLSSDPIKSGGFVTEGEERGTVFFRDGEVIDAKLGRLIGLEAVYRMLLWDDGVFEIEFKNIAREDAIQTSTQAILLEGMRQVDEWSRFSDLIPPVNARLTVDYNALARAYPESVPPEMKPVLHLFDGRRSIFEVVSDAPGDDAIALDVIADLHRYGILQAAHRDTSEAAVEAWLSQQPAMATDPSLPSALANALIPSPRTASQLLRPDAEPTLVGQQAYVRRDPTQRTLLPEPIPEPSRILSRHTVPANRALPLTEPPAPIPLTHSRPSLRIQRVASSITRIPTALAEAKRPEIEEEDDGWAPVHTAPSPSNLHRAPVNNGAYVIAPAAAPSWPIGQTKPPAPAIKSTEREIDTRDMRSRAEPEPADKDEFKPSNTSEWYSKSQDSEIVWDGPSNVWKQRFTALLLVGSVAAVVGVLLAGNPRNHEMPEQATPANQDSKRAGWPKTDETGIVIRGAVPEQPSATLPPPAELKTLEPAAVEAKAPPIVEAKAPPTAIEAPPPKVEPPAPKIEKAALDESLGKAEKLLSGGNLKIAKQEFSKIIELDPNNADAQSGLAMVFVELGSDGAAKKAAQTALKIDQNQARAQLVLALIATNGNDMATAKKYYQKYLALAPSGKHAEEVRRILKTLE